MQNFCLFFKSQFKCYSMNSKPVFFIGSFYYKPAYIDFKYQLLQKCSYFLIDDTKATVQWFIIHNLFDEYVYTFFYMGRRLRILNNYFTQGVAWRYHAIQKKTLDVIPGQRFVNDKVHASARKTKISASFENIFETVALHKIGFAYCMFCHKYAYIVV